MNPSSDYHQPQVYPNLPINNPGFNQGPMINLPAPSAGYPANVNEEQMKHYLSNINSATSSKLTFIGIFYILMGILNIGLEFALISRGNVSFFGCFGNGTFLFITGVITLILCRQQVFGLTSLLVVLIFQLHVTIAVFCLYAFAVYVLSDCYDGYHTYFCSPFEAALIICIADLVHIFFTFCVIIANLGIIGNARDLPTVPIASGYIMYTPQAQAAPITFQNPHATPVNAMNSA